jgi:hypothetical protein
LYTTEKISGFSPEFADFETHFASGMARESPGGEGIMQMKGLRSIN